MATLRTGAIYDGGRLIRGKDCEGASRYAILPQPRPQARNKQKLHHLGKQSSDDPNHTGESQIHTAED